MDDNVREEERRAKLRELVEKTRQTIKKSDVQSENAAIVETSRRIAAGLEQSKNVDPQIFKAPITV
ncbi:MAG: hypothetical protein ACLP5H_31520 [Desulfomonilaceae bacterium]